MFCAVTCSGYVIFIAMSRGTPTSQIARFGSGEMTVRPEKFTRFPERLPRKRPCLPFSRWHSPRAAFVLAFALFTRGSVFVRGSSELMYSPTLSCKLSHCSITVLNEIPRSMLFSISLLRATMSLSFTVRSSSLLPIADSICTDGRMHAGGTRRWVRIILLGVPWNGSKSSAMMSSVVIRVNKFSTRTGFRSSCTLDMCGSSSLLHSSA